MHATVIQMYSALSQDAAATIDVPADGELISCMLGATGVLNADTEEFAAELSFGSVSARTSNDARQVLAVIRQKMGMLTTGAGNSSVMQLFTFGDGVQVFAGERLYLHTGATGGTLSTAWCMLILQLKGFQARRR